jgi:predicted DNA-binding protein
MARRGSDLPKLELLAFRAPVELIQDLEDIAERRGEPKSALVRQAVEAFLSEPKNRRRKAS